MNTFPQPGQPVPQQQNFQQFAGQPAAAAPGPAPAQFATQPQQFAPPPGAQPQQFAQAPLQNGTQQFAPAPQPYAQPMLGQPQYAQQPMGAQPMAAPGTAFGPGAFDGTSIQQHQDPSPNEGHYVLEIDNTQLKTLNGRTHVTTFSVIEATSLPAPQLGQPASPVGSRVAAPQKLDGNKWAFQYGTGAILAMTMAMTGFIDEATFKTAVPAWSPLLNAMCDDKQQLPGNPWPANPLKGRRARCTVTWSGKMTKANAQGKQSPIMNFAWSVL